MYMGYFIALESIMKLILKISIEISGIVFFLVIMLYFLVGASKYIK